MSKLLSTILPSLLAGGLLFGSALTGAQPAPPPTPPTPPTAPLPRPPKAVVVKGDIHIDVKDIERMVDEQIRHAIEAVNYNPNIPPQIRDKVKARLEKVRVKVKARLAKVGTTDPEALGDELGKLGDEIGEEMDQFGQDMDKWGKQFEKEMEKKGKELEKQMKRQRFQWHGGGSNVDVSVDTGDEEDIPGMPDVDDADDMDDAMRDLGSLKLNANQRAQLKQLRTDSDAQVANAKRGLERAAETLRSQLEQGTVSEDEIKRSIDNVTKLEGDIRKARIIAWVKARQILDGTQREKVERAARKGK